MAMERTHRAKVPSLFPHEHGAYVTLLTPLASAMLFAPSGAALAWALVACALFVAHEPLCLLLGRRGARKRELAAPAARRALLVLAAFALPTALALAFTSRPLFAEAVLATGSVCTAAAGFLALGREKTLSGELVITAALITLSLPALALAGIEPRAAARFALAWLAVHGLAMVTARAYVYRKREGLLLLRVASALALLLVIAAIVAVSTELVAWALVLAPCLVALVPWSLTLDLFRPRTPKQLGWALAAAMLPGVVAIGLTLR